MLTRNHNTVIITVMLSASELKGACAVSNTWFVQTRLVKELLIIHLDCLTKPCDISHLTKF